MVSASENFSFTGAGEIHPAGLTFSFPSDLNTTSTDVVPSSKQILDRVGDLKTGNARPEQSPAQNTTFTEKRSRILYLRLLLVLLITYLTTSIAAAQEKKVTDEVESLQNAIQLVSSMLEAEIRESTIELDGKVFQLTVSEIKPDTISNGLLTDSGPDVFQDPEADDPPPKKVLSISLMKVTKDMVRNPVPPEQIDVILQRALELGATHLSIETPYDNPTGGDSVGYTKLWIEKMRAVGLKVWHRHMPLAFEGIYDVPKELRRVGSELTADEQVRARSITSVPFERIDQYQIQIYEYILAHPEMFQPDDIFTPTPEPDNHGVLGITYCADDQPCQFRSIVDFNQWLIETDSIAEEALSKIGFTGDIKVGNWGFSGYTAANLNNPDWQEWHTVYLSCEAIESMDKVVAIDHYPPPESTMEADLNTALERIQNSCPHLEGISLALSEFSHEDPVRLREFLDAIFYPENPEISINIVNYWSFVGGVEELINGVNLEPTDRFYIVQEFYQANQ